MDIRTLPDIKDLMEPPECAISAVLIPSLTEHNCSVAERKLLALPTRMGGLGMTNPSESAESEYRKHWRISRTPSLATQISEKKIGKK